MMRKILQSVCLIVGTGLVVPAIAEEFGIAFEWGDIPRCTSGNPNTVDNPVFALSNVPDGTVEIRFKMKDRDAPSYNHGGGTAAYNGENAIQPGVFKYESPCPPGGKHTYEWTATAMDGEGGKLGKAKARKKYPE